MINKLKNAKNNYLYKHKKLMQILYKPLGLIEPFLNKKFLNEKFYLSIQPEMILAGEYTKNNEFGRYDIIIKIIVAEQYVNKEKNPFKLYEKHNKFFNIHNKTKERYKKVIDLMLIKNITIQHPIFLSRGQQLFDGNHRLAMALILDYETIQCQMVRYAKNIHKKTLEDLFDKGFSKEECKIIKNRKDKLFHDKGLYFPIIVELKNADNIMKYIKKEHKIYKEERYSVDIVIYNKIAELINSSISIYTNYLEKIETFKGIEKKISVIWIEIANPEYRKINSFRANNFVYSSKIRKLKKEIEKKHNSIEVLMSDNNIINKEIRKILNEKSNNE